MKITNLAAFDAAIRAVCPEIDGVAADGHIFFHAKADPTQIAAANTAAASYVDPAPAMVLDVNALAALLQAKGVITAGDLASVHKAQAPVVMPTISTSTVSMGTPPDVLTP